MYPRCKTCKYWNREEDTSSRYFWAPPVGGENKEPQHEAHECRHPSKKFWDPPEADGFTLMDGDYYVAQLYTAENFGCVLHSELESIG